MPLRPGVRVQLRLALAALAAAVAAPALAQGQQLGPVTPAEVAQAVPSVRSSLPMRIDEITQVVGIRADGTHFVYDVAISEAVPTERVEQIRQEFQAESQTRLCANPDTSSFIRRGGGMRHRYSDTTGLLFETRVVSCP